MRKDIHEESSLKLTKLPAREFTLQREQHIYVYCNELEN